MIKAIIYYDGSLNADLCGYLQASECVSDLFPGDRLTCISGEYGYTSNMGTIQLCASFPTDYVIFTNSLFVFNADVVKEQCSNADGGLTDFYILHDGKIDNINLLTDKWLSKTHNLEKIIINGGLEKLYEEK